MSSLIRGRLFDAATAPSIGERSAEVARMGGTVIEQILSGQLDQPIGYDQDHDEWVVLLSGGAELEVDGKALSMISGDWVLLPRRTPHRLVRTTPGTSWLAVHVEPR